MAGSLDNAGWKQKKSEISMSLCFRAIAQVMTGFKQNKDHWMIIGSPVVRFQSSTLGSLGRRMLKL